MLSELAIKNAKPKAKPYKIGDSGGLYLLVNSIGSKLWRLKYRFEGREKSLSLGKYPDVSLKKARQRRDAAREQLADGLDPGVEKKAAKEKRIQETEHTFRKVAEGYLAKIEAEGRAPATLEKNRRMVNTANQDFGDTPIIELDTPTILKTLKRIEASKKYETANRLRTIIGSVCRFAIASGMIPNDPTTNLQGALIRPERKARAAILDPVKFGGLLRAIDQFDGQPVTCLALQLMALLYPRPGELRHAEWVDVNFDDKVWVIPAHRAKMRREHHMPLSDAVIACLDELKKHSGNTVLMFPSIRSVTRPISDNTMNAAMRRMGFSSEEMTAHGFRASFSTMANESGKWHPDAIERALAHQERNEVRRAYARGAHWQERVKMADWWAVELGKMRKSSS